MMTFTIRRGLAGDLCNSSAAATLTPLDTLMNAKEKQIISSRPWKFLNKQYTLLTAASTSSYALPPYTSKPESVYITSGSQKFVPKEVTLASEWDRLTTTTVTSDSVTHYRVYDGAIEFFPRPTTASNTITFNARRIARDLNTADITNLTITTLANASTALTTSTGLTAQHAGFWIRPTFSTSANTGDGNWYEIAAYLTATTATLARKYGGVSIAAGTAACTIAQVSLIPEPHDMLPIYAALQVYFTSVDPNSDKATLYKDLFQTGYGQMLRADGSESGVVLDTGEGYEYKNPNFYVSL